MEIRHIDTTDAGQFFIADENETLAELTYRWSAPGVFIIDHTEVSERLAGQGIGKKLVMAAVAFAREGNHKVIPICPFARKILLNNADFKDVLHQV